MKVAEWANTLVTICVAITAVGAVAYPLYRIIKLIDVTVKRPYPCKKLENLQSNFEKLQEDFETLSVHVQKDYKARQRSEQMQKVQIKALIAMLENRINGNNIDSMQKVKEELQNSLVEFM